VLTGGARRRRQPRRPKYVALAKDQGRGSSASHSAGNGSSNHLAIELLHAAGDTQAAARAAYKGSGPALTDLNRQPGRVDDGPAQPPRSATSARAASACSRSHRSGARRSCRRCRRSTSSASRATRRRPSPASSPRLGISPQITEKLSTALRKAMGERDGARAYRAMGVEVMDLARRSSRRTCAPRLREVAQGRATRATSSSNNGATLSHSRETGPCAFPAPRPASSLRCAPCRRARKRRASTSPTARRQHPRHRSGNAESSPGDPGHRRCPRHRFFGRLAGAFTWEQRESHRTLDVFDRTARERKLAAKVKLSGHPDNIALDPRPGARVYVAIVGDIRRRPMVEWSHGANHCLALRESAKDAYPW